jgi:hypothetical protein
MDMFNLEMSFVKKVEFDRDTLSYNSGFRLLVGDPETFKTTFSVNAMRDMLRRGKISDFIYVDFDPKDGEEVNTRAKIAKEEGWKYISAMNPVIRAKFKTNWEVLEYALQSAKEGSGITIDTVNKILADEDSNNLASKIASTIKEYATSKQMLIDIIGHYGKDKSKGLRGASSVIGDVGYILDFQKVSAMETNIFVGKDSKGRSRAYATSSLMKISFPTPESDTVEGVVELVQSNSDRDKTLTPVEQRELKLAQQRAFLVTYVGSLLSSIEEDKVGLTKLKNFVMRNINRLSDGTKKLPDNEEYVLTAIVKDELKNVLENTFVTIQETTGKSKKPITFVMKVDKGEFMREHKLIKLPEVYKINLLDVNKDRTNV